MLNQTVVDVYGNRDKRVSQNDTSHHHLLPLLDKETVAVTAMGSNEEDGAAIRPKRDSRSRKKKSREKQGKRHWEEKVSNEGAELTEEKKKSECNYCWSGTGTSF